MRIVRVLVVMVGVLTLVSGCVGVPVQPSPDVGVTSEPPVDPGVEAAVGAYQAMWREFGVASRTADWQSPELARYAAGYALDQLVQSLQADEVQGVHVTGTFTTAPTVVSAMPTDAPNVVRIADCGDDSDTTRVRASDGEILPGGDRGRRRIDAEVRLDDGVWKVVDFRLRGAGTC